MPNIKDTILLDYRNYIENVNQWNVPLLNLSGIKSEQLVINGQRIPYNKYKIENNFIVLSDDLKVNKDTVAHLIVEFNPSSIKTTFWLPIILAFIGLVGTLGQPVLHYLGYMYKSNNKLHIENTSLSYDTKNNAVTGKVDVHNLENRSSYISEDELKNWQLYIATKEEENNLDPDKQTFKYYSGPFELDQYAKPISVITDSAFTQKMVITGKRILTVMAIVKKGTPVYAPFCPNSIKDGSCKLINTAYYSINEIISSN